MTDHDERDAPPKVTLGELNALSEDAFCAHLGPVFENAPWIARAASTKAPFESLTALHRAMVSVLDDAPAETINAFLNGHPRLTRNVSAKVATAESVAEQTSAGLNAIDPTTADELADLNEAYYEKFGFPFILAVRFARPQTILSALRHRIARDPTAETRAALREIEAITWMRLLERVAIAKVGGLSVNVIDLVTGKPATGLHVTLSRKHATGEIAPLADGTVDARGVVEFPGTEDLGGYLLAFDLASYFAGQGHEQPAFGFLDTVEFQFRITNPEEHYHVPLRLTPYSIMAYRGL